MPEKDTKQHIAKRITFAFGRGARRTIDYALSPAFVAIGSLVMGGAFMSYGVYLLAGLGWAFIAGSVPQLVLGLFLLRGMIRGG